MQNSATDTNKRIETVDTLHRLMAFGFLDEREEMLLLLLGGDRTLDGDGATMMAV